MPNYLAIDTATECCSAALWFDGKLYHKNTVQPQKHAELILGFVEDLLLEANAKKSDLDGLIIGQGPGAFTGVRIATGVAQGIALGLSLPVVAVSNLQTLAYRAYIDSKTSEEKTILVAADARMKEVYTAKYKVSSTTIEQLTPEQVISPNQVNTSSSELYIGSGFHVYKELIKYRESNSIGIETHIFSEAKDMLLMVKDEFVSLAQSIDKIEPVYLREP